jgi:hypothetical protein
MSSEQQPRIRRLKNYLLLYKTKSGTPRAWCIRSGQPVEDVPYQLKLAALDYLDSPEGKQFIKDERSRDQQIEISQVMMNISSDL